jgi:hypothetical protein
LRPDHIMIIERDSVVSSPTISRPRHRVGLGRRIGDALNAIFGSLSARRMLKRIVIRPKARGAPDLSPHLLRDIGLPPDARAGGQAWWDHQ